MSEKCTHSLAEQETACADGMCPLCLVAVLDGLRRQLAQAKEKNERLRAENDLLDENIGEWKEASGLIVNGNPAGVTPGMLEMSRQKYDTELARLQAVLGILSKTADGVPVVAGDKVWSIYDGVPRLLCVKEAGHTASNYPYSHVTHLCYSTREVAEDELRKAREAVEAANKQLDKQKSIWYNTCRELKSRLCGCPVEGHIRPLPIQAVGSSRVIIGQSCGQSSVTTERLMPMFFGEWDGKPDPVSYD